MIFQSRSFPMTDERGVAAAGAGRGDAAGRDRHVHGGKVHGDQVAGDQIRTGDITNSVGVAIGEHINQAIYLYQHAPRRPVDAAQLVAAQAQLAGLLPAGSRMELSTNPLFVGRADDLRALAKALKGDQTVAITQVQTAAATGWGGVGKTQLAVEFAHRYGQYFAGGVFWLNFADPGGVSSEVAL
jgi:hypothetical protein